MQARLLASSLRAAGHQVQVLAPRLDHSSPRHDWIDGIEVTRLQYPRWRGVGALLLNLRFGAWLMRHRGQFDAVHIHMMHNLAGAAGWMRPLIGIPVAVKVSGAAEFEGGVLDPALRGMLKHRFLNAGSRRLDAFQCISSHTARMMLAAGYPAQRLHFIPNAVDVARFTRAEVADPRVMRVVFVGRHVPVKSLDVLLRAWSLLRLPNRARLVLAGDGPEHKALRGLAEELGIAGSVEFPGMVRNVPELLAGASLYVQASRSEGLPNSVLEAMAAALPVVATRISGHEDVVRDGESGLLVPVGEPQALADALQRLFDDPALRRRLGDAGRATVEREYDVPVVLRRLCNMYVARGDGDAQRELSDGARL